MRKESSSLYRRLQALRERDPAAHRAFINSMQAFIASCIDEESAERQAKRRRSAGPRALITSSKKH